MDGFFEFFNQHATGILVFLVVVLVLAVLCAWFIQKLAWVMRWGRYKDIASPPASAAESALSRAYSVFLTKLVDDFRLLLALLIFLLFTGVLFFGIWVAHSPSGGFDEVGKAIQAIVASLGGFVGTIMGYYFGQERSKPATEVSVPPPKSPPSPTGAVQPQQPPPDPTAVAAVQLDAP